MDSYVRFDPETGKEVDRKLVGKGRPPVGYVRMNEDGEEVIRSSTPQTNKTPRIAAPKAPKAVYVYALFDGNEIIDVKPCKRGRPPVGYEKILESEVPDDDTEASTEASTDTGNADEIARILDDDEFDEPDPPQPITAVPGDIDHQRVFAATKSCTFTRFNDYIDATRIDGLDDDDKDIISILACDIQGRADEILDFFHLGQTFARIDIHKVTGDISIWKGHASGDADIIITGAIIEESVESR